MKKIIFSLILAPLFTLLFVSCEKSDYLDKEPTKPLFKENTADRNTSDSPTTLSDSQCNMTISLNGSSSASFRLCNIASGALCEADCNLSGPNVLGGARTLNCNVNPPQCSTTFPVNKWAMFAVISTDTSTIYLSIIGSPGGYISFSLSPGATRFFYANSNCAVGNTDCQ